jgi:predicted alpha/beta hydrolase family esterase
MKKVFVVHGFGAGPNSSWFPWLMAELKKHDVYACALPMPEPENPICDDWVHEITRQVEMSKNDEVYFVGHSLGVAAILNYLEASSSTIAGTVLVSGRFEKPSLEKVAHFYKTFDFEKIKSRAHKFVVIHGDQDTWVPVENAEKLSRVLEAELLIIKGAGHLVGSEGVRELPGCLDAVLRIIV